MKLNILSTAFFLIFTQLTAIAQLQYYYEDFDEYVTNQQLACQNPIDWTTWSNLPCDPVEDPYLSSAISISLPNSLKIVSYNDLIKLLGNISSGRNHITFLSNIPNGKSGYFSLLSQFSPDPIELAVECYFEVGGVGRLEGIPDAPIPFTYTNNLWQLIWVVVDFEKDEAQLWIDYSLVHIWEYSQNGSLTSQLAAQNFYGPSTTNSMYIDDYWLYDNTCLNCLPPPPPTNLTVQQIMSPDPKIQLTWQGNYWNQYAFKIIRKNSLPTSSNEYEVIGIVSQGVNQYLDSEIVVDSTYTYGVLALNMYGNSDTSNTASITVLPIPVELISFTADVIKDDVQLNWSTATETNNSGFEILRRVYPERNRRTQNDNVWNKLGFVPGQGTTTEPQFYSFTDEAVEPGSYQYRLKQIDFDGSIEFSEIVEVTVEGPTEFSLSQNYPNPFNPTTKIKYTIPTPPVSSPLVKGRTKEGFVSLKVYDVLGNEVATLVNEEKSAGEYEVEFFAAGLPSGIYFYQICVGSYLESKKMVLLK